MRITSLQEFVSSSLSASASRSTSAGDFQAALAAAKNADSATATPKSEEPAKAVKKTALDELEEYLRKSPAERMREAILKRLGLTEADLAAMPPEKRTAVENEIAREIKEFMLGQQSSTPPQAGEQSALSIQSLLAGG